MKPYLYATLLAIVASAVAPLYAAEISGKVSLTGTPKAEIPLPLDATCGKLHPKPITTRHFLVGKDNGLANVFVYLKDAPKAPAKGGAPLLDQKDCLYQPYVMGVVAGQKFKVRNSDAFLHNVHSTPKDPANKEFNIGQPLQGLVNEVSFDKPEVLVRMKCEVHPWMFAYVGVCEHPYFAVTDKDGNFKISGVPAGKYTVEAFHLKAGAKTQETTVGDADKKTLDFSLAAP